MIFKTIDTSHLDFKALEYSTKYNIDDCTHGAEFGYTRENTRFSSCYPEDEFQTLADSFFDGDNDLFCVKQDPGQHFVPHADEFKRLRKKHGVDPDDCIRIMIFLQDWKSGHYFEIAEQPIVQWRAGDVCLIRQGHQHLSMNGGTVPKYTCQITGLRSNFKHLVDIQGK